MEGEGCLQQREQHGEWLRGRNQQELRRKGSEWSWCQEGERQGRETRPGLEPAEQGGCKEENSAQFDDEKTPCLLGSERPAQEEGKLRVTAKTSLPTPNLFYLELLALQVQRSKEIPHKFELYVLTTIPGLSYRYYSIRSSEQALKGKQATTATMTFTSKLYHMPRKLRTRPSGKNLVSVKNDCYTIFLDPDTNLMHSIWER